MTKVFISHKKEDASKAAEIASILKDNRIDYYLDVLDDKLQGNGDRLTSQLRDQLERCTHLLAVLSERTQSSWWVPFEIGLATEKTYPISSFLSFINKQDIPDYLWKWPALRTLSDLNQYIQLLQKEKGDIILQESAFGQFSANSANYKYAEAFHRKLRRNLNQP